MYIVSVIIVTKELLNSVDLMRNEMIYIAAPYTHKDPAIVQERVNKVTKYTAERMAQGDVVFSPLTHSHTVADYLPDDLRFSQEFWMYQDLGILKFCSKLVVLMLDGWKDSVGLKTEMNFAHIHNVPIEFVKE